MSSRRLGATRVFDALPILRDLLDVEVLAACYGHVVDLDWNQPVCWAHCNIAGRNLVAQFIRCVGAQRAQPPVSL